MGVDILKKLLEYRDSKQYTFILFKVGEGQIYTGFRKVCAWGGGGGVLARTLYEMLGFLIYF